MRRDRALAAACKAAQSTGGRLQCQGRAKVDERSTSMGLEIVGGHSMGHSARMGNATTDAAASTASTTGATTTKEAPTTTGVASTMRAASTTCAASTAGAASTRADNNACP